MDFFTNGFWLYIGKILIFRFIFKNRGRGWIPCLTITLDDRRLRFAIFHIVIFVVTMQTSQATFGNPNLEHTSDCDDSHCCKDGGGNECG